MRLDLFEARKVHGYLNFNINFFPDVTFLVGINGSGKTSVLKLILGLTSPSYEYLSQISYEYCRVVYYNESTREEITITSFQKEDHVNLEISKKNKDIETKPVLISEKNIKIYIAQKSHNKQYKEELEKFESLEIVSLIKELSTPKFLGLDRRVYEGRSIDNISGITTSINWSSARDVLREYEMELMKGGIKSTNDGSPLQSVDASLREVQNLVKAHSNRVSVEQIQKGEKFRQKISQAAFEYIEYNDANEENISFKPEKLEHIIKRRESVTHAINDLGLNYLDESVNSFFNNLEASVKVYLKNQNKNSNNKNSNNKNSNNKNSNNKNKKSSIDNKAAMNKFIKPLFEWMYNSGKLRQIDQIISFSKEYQSEVEQLKEPASRLEEITTNFLKEGNKALEVSEEGNINVILKTGNLMNLSHLSSGEKQIIIMIAHLIFEENVKPSGVFIIDEPELSLHIAWQEIFVESIMNASPKTQFILATHSPSIISSSYNEVYCQDLSTSNS